MILQIIGILFLLLLIGGLIFVYTGPDLLPSDIDQIIQKVMDDEIPNLISGETGFAENDGRSLWYEIRKPEGETKGTILLVMGHSGSSMLWPEHLIEPLRAAGYQVIRYDNRGVGKSDWIKDWKKSKAYDLEDMARDGMAILSDNGVEQAHIVGASMGGMIAQHMALNHPDRVLSMTSIFSSGFMYDPEIKPVNKKHQIELVRRILRYMILGGASMKNMMKLSICIVSILKGDTSYEPDYEEIAQRVRFESSVDRKFNRTVGVQHTEAIRLSGSRLGQLSNINLPVTVIHGRKDPLVYPEHAEKYAPLIPNAEMIWIDDMGHELHQQNTPKIVEATLQNIRSMNNE